MKQFIKSFIPDSIRRGPVGDLYRMLRGRPSSEPVSSRPSYGTENVSSTEPSEDSVRGTEAESLRLMCNDICRLE